MSIERRPSGGATVTWTDLPGQAMVFDDVTAAGEFCRDSPLEMFAVYFVPAAGLLPPAAAPPPRQVESEADFLKRLSRIRAEAEARQAASAMTQGEADDLRAMGLM